VEDPEVLLQLLLLLVKVYSTSTAGLPLWLGCKINVAQLVGD
jgi:hypothetical protein